MANVCQVFQWLARHGDRRRRAPQPGALTESGVQPSTLKSSAQPLHFFFPTAPSTPAIWLLAVDEYDGLVEWRPARTDVMHCNVLVPDRHATEADEPVGG